MKNENTPAVSAPNTTSAPLRVKTNVRAGAWYHWFFQQQPTPSSGVNAVAGVRG